MISRRWNQSTGKYWTKLKRKPYGYGRGRAHPSVEYCACPVCNVGPGVLCKGADGEPHLGRHYLRVYAYRDYKRNRGAAFALECLCDSDD